MKEAAWAIYLNVCVFFAPVFLSEPIKLVFHLASLAADSIDLYQFLGLFNLNDDFICTFLKASACMHESNTRYDTSIQLWLTVVRFTCWSSQCAPNIAPSLAALVRSVLSMMIKCNEPNFLLFHIHRVTRSACDEVYWFWNGATLSQFILKCSKFQAVDLFLSFLYLNAA